jgi:hypothetical protein
MLAKLLGIHRSPRQSELKGTNRSGSSCNISPLRQSFRGHVKHESAGSSAFAKQPITSHRSLLQENTVVQMLQHWSTGRRVKDMGRRAIEVRNKASAINGPRQGDTPNVPGMPTKAVASVERLSTVRQSAAVEDRKAYGSRRFLHRHRQRTSSRDRLHFEASACSWFPLTHGLLSWSDHLESALTVDYLPRSVHVTITASQRHHVLSAQGILQFLLSRNLPI